ncbi:tetratricopeptide repeat protein [Pseudemcibacter aquimaris]|uniref:tetratricopeptide repeat protein n=1 Tax=Pseudemcibacter aquimaris TaxID=2857064 RepID=UPI002012EE26|nr:tetratricopeptide repeat protein [Pseudemcibacter aquimaris]MCC3861868.1 tetratricopeptide repeat protein [Pseudemcibacter aquimaris]WDU58621.1 tetratricopeptide repeat protein [Pseudemcibacter aquimaris]
MIRLTIFTVIGISLALVAAWIAANPGDVLISWQGWEIRFSVAVSVMLLVLYTAALLFTLKILKWMNISALLGSPKRMVAKRAKADKMMDQAWGAYALDDYDNAIKHALRAKGAIGENTEILRFLASATEKLGKDKNPYFEKLALSEENQIWTGKIKLEKLIKNKNWPAATSLITTLREQAPKNAWLLEQYIYASARTGNWQETLDAIKVAEKQKGVISPATLKNIKAATEYALALEKKAGGKKQECASLLKSALKLDPAFSPAALALAKLHLEQNDPNAAEKVIRNIWKKAPNDELAEMLLELYPQESNSEAYRRIKKIADSAPEFVESAHIMAEAAINAEQWPDAKTALNKIIGGPDEAPKTYLLLAKLEEKQKGPGEAAENYKNKSAKLSHKNQWVCTHCDTKHNHYTPLCTSCGEFNNIIWQRA